MTVKRFQLEYADNFQVVVEIDGSILTDDKLHEINNFWSNVHRFVFIG